MKVTEFRVMLHSEYDYGYGRDHGRDHGRSDPEKTGLRPKLLAVVTIVLDEKLVIHGIKVISGRNGLFISLPNEKKHDHCPECKKKNPVTAAYCNYCGATLDGRRWESFEANKKGFVNLYNDIVHPLDNDFRNYLEDVCLQAYEEELEKGVEKEKTDLEAIHS